MKTKTPSGKIARIALILMAGILLVSNAVFAQQESRNVYDFTEVSYALPGRLEITQGNKEQLILIGDKDDLERITTKTEGNELKIYCKENNVRLGDVVVKLTVTDLKELSVAGSADVEFMNEFSTHKFEVELAGSGNIECKTIKVESLELSMAGSGDMIFGGKVNDGLEIEIAGSGEIDCSNLEAKNVEVEIAGSGEAKVWATEKLDSEIMGSGDIYYKGNPRVESSVAGSGKTHTL